MPNDQWPTDEQWERVITGYDPGEVETVARALHAALDWSLRTPPATTPWRQDTTPLTWEQLGEATHAHWRGQARAAIDALEEHRAGGEGDA
jgi:hypothetical protein